jgi:hypothetical protein
VKRHQVTSRLAVNLSTVLHRQHPWHVPGPEYPLSNEQNLDEHDSLMNVGLIQGWSLGSMGPLVQLINRHNRHSEAILGFLERRRCITWHGGGLTAPRGSSAPIHPHARRN